jgi:Tfp pilus assembly protein FimT
LDYNDYNRVLFWGKGFSDFGLVSINKPDDVAEFKMSSSIFSGAIDRKSAKAISVFIKFKHTKANAEKNGAVKIANNYVERMKKLFKDAFFVFGYNFNNADQDDLLRNR